MINVAYQESFGLQDEFYVNLGPIPPGVPVNLIANIDLEADKFKLVKAVLSLINAVDKVRELRAQNANNSQGLRGARQQDAEIFMKIAGADLLAVSKCKDMVVNRGHYFGTKYSPLKRSGLSSEEQAELIEFLKHL